MWTYPKVVAHRGGGILAPENTLDAMQCGFDRGFRAVEFDVMLSKDGVPVLMHDADFGRTVKGSGSVATTLAADLVQMDAGSWLSPTFSAVRVPTYEQIFRFCQMHGIWMNVEIKPALGFDQATGAEVARLTNTLMVSDANFIAPLFSSFAMEALISAKQVAPHIPRAWLTDSIPTDWLQYLQLIEAVSLHTNHEYLSREQAIQVKQAGYGLFCYTVNTLERAHEILSWGVDGFCTDRIDLIPADLYIAK